MADQEPQPSAPSPSVPPAGSVSIDVRDLYAEIGELNMVVKLQSQMLERQRVVIAALQARLPDPPSDQATEP